MAYVPKPPTPKTEPDRVDSVPKGLSLSSDTDPPVLDPEFATKPAPERIRVDFRGEEFVRAIRQHGKFVTWRKAMPCPCFEAETNQAGINCAFCNGSGWSYVDPVNIQALVFAVDKSVRLHERYGIWLSGTSSITTEVQHRLGFRDSIQLRDHVMLFSELIKKGNRRGIRQSLPARMDTCRYRIVNLTQMFVLQGTNAFALSEGTHFVITKDGWIEWSTIGNSLIPDGTYVSVRYEFHPVFVIESFPHALRGDTTMYKSVGETVYGLPMQSVGKLDYLLDSKVELPTSGGL